MEQPEGHHVDDDTAPADDGEAGEAEDLWGEGATGEGHETILGQHPPGLSARCLHGLLTFPSAAMVSRRARRHPDAGGAANKHRNGSTCGRVAVHPCTA